MAKVGDGTGFGGPKGEDANSAFENAKPAESSGSGVGDGGMGPKLDPAGNRTGPPSR